MKNIIEAIEKQLQAQKDDIFFKDIQINDLKEKLTAAEKERDEMAAKLAAVEKHLDRVVMNE